MINNEEEIWRTHPEIEKIEVSTFGKVRTLDRVVSSEKRTQFIKGQVLKQNVINNGYLQVQFRVNGKRIHKLVHRLVAETFLSNHDNLPYVNHKDCDTTNNNVDNLEFCTASYNRRYQEKFGISSSEARGHPLFAVNLSTLEVSHFRAQIEASRLLGVDRRNINKVIKGKYKQTGGFWFTNADKNADDVINRKIQEIGGTGLKTR